MNNTNNTYNNNINQTIPYFGVDDFSLHDFSLHDFVDPPLNFDHVLGILGENKTRNVIIQDNNQHAFNNFNSNNNSMVNSLSGIDHDKFNNDDNEEEDEDDDNLDNSSGNNNSNSNNSNEQRSKTGGKVDRSRTLVSERRRRGKMKEKLYALRALVPNITKMDKASIVGDAVLYLQDLQLQEKQLKSQIQGLESSFETATIFQSYVDITKNNVPLLVPVCKIIMQLEVVQIEVREFYVKVISNKGGGVAGSLYKALDSLTNFVIKSSNLSSLSDQFVLTFTINVGKCMDNFNIPNIKLWISGALLNQGFSFQNNLHNEVY